MNLVIFILVLNIIPAFCIDYLFCFLTATAILLYVCKLQFVLVYAIGLSYAGERSPGFLPFPISSDWE
jgi:hypothetical protein